MCIRPLHSLLHRARRNRIQLRPAAQRARRRDPTQPDQHKPLRLQQTAMGSRLRGTQARRQPSRIAARAGCLQKGRWFCSPHLRLPCACLNRPRILADCKVRRASNSKQPLAGMLWQRLCSASRKTGKPGPHCQPVLCLASLLKDDQKTEGEVVIICPTGLYRKRSCLLVV